MTPRTLRAVIAVMAAALVLALTAPAAHAQEVSRPQLSEAQKQKTKEHYEKATLLYNVAKYPEAITEYEAAYLISADPAMLFNIAQCHRKNNQPEEAARFYRNYLRNAPNAPRREDVEKWIAEMDRAAEEKRRQATTPPVTTPPTSPATTPGVTTIPPPAGGTTPPGMGLPPGTAPEATTGSPYPPLEPAPAPAKRSRVLPLTLMIGGGVLVGTSLVFAAVAGQKAKEIEDLAMRRGPFDSKAKDIEDQGKAASALAVVSGLVGLAAGATGTWLYIRTPASSERADARPAVYPLAGRGLVGGGARFIF
jgi:tetratricopeptide (TPR) repeat protein